MIFYVNFIQNVKKATAENLLIDKRKISLANDSFLDRFTFPSFAQKDKAIGTEAKW